MIYLLNDVEMYLKKEFNINSCFATNTRNSLNHKVSNFAAVNSQGEIKAKVVIALKDT